MTISPIREAETLDARRVHFLHQDGFMLSMILGGFAQGEVLSQFSDGRAPSVAELAEATSARIGILHVALRCLAAQGWLERSGLPSAPTLTYRLTAEGQGALPFVGHYEQVAAFTRKHAPFDGSHKTRAFRAWKRRSQSRRFRHQPRL